VHTTVKIILEKADRDDAIRAMHRKLAETAAAATAGT
jgi:hypothetical protein